MKTSIRPATGGCPALSLLAREIQALHVAALPWHFRRDIDDLFPPEDLSELLEQPDNLILIAETDSAAAAGYAYAEFIRHVESTLTHCHQQLYLHHLGIRAGQCRKGIGTALIAVDVWRFNEDARAFYRRHGFETYNEVMWSR